MNLKEAFRYQKFLDSIMRRACSKISDTDQCMKTIRNHKRHDANPEAEDLVETIEREYPYGNNDIIALCIKLVKERELLSKAITEAKCDAQNEFHIDIDASIETNKFRQLLSESIQLMSRISPITRTERGTDYKFNNDGNQAPYYYTVEVSRVEDYDKVTAKKIMFDMGSTADSVSSDIDAALINTNVLYEAPWNVNASFDDVLAEFVTSRETTVS